MATSEAANPYRRRHNPILLAPYGAIIPASAVPIANPIPPDRRHKEPSAVPRFAGPIGAGPASQARKLEVHLLGRVAYRQAWEMQEQMAAGIASGERPASLLLLEHPHTYTFGRSGHSENMLWGAERLAAEGVEVYWVDRGGDVTYHGPGQLVGYPLLPLGRPGGNGLLPQPDFIGYLRQLEACLTDTLASFGIPGGQIPGRTGVWIQADFASRCPHCPPAARLNPSKIASIGVKVDVNGITRHGFSLNVSPDMRYWDGIVACGLAGTSAISMADLQDPPPPLPEVAQRLIPFFGKRLGYEPILMAFPASPPPLA
jgi:lipoyl(octanoyl) transferase